MLWTGSTYEYLDRFVVVCLTLFAQLVPVKRTFSLKYIIPDFLAVSFDENNEGYLLKNKFVK